MIETLEILRPILKIEDGMTPTYGRLTLEPLERGYGMTLGNALRRVLLSSIRGAAITAVRIDGVLHEFSTIPGVREDVIQILMNLKHIPVKSKSRDVRVITMDIEKQEAGVLTAGDIPQDLDVEFVDPSAVICTVEAHTRLSIDFYVEQGTGYLPAERQRPLWLPVDALLTDAIFSPVLRVNYDVGAARVGQRTDYESLVLDVWTNGIVTPDLALGESAKIIQTYFSYVVANVDKTDVIDLTPPEPKTPQGPGGDPEIINRPVRELELSIRSENCLLRGGIQTIGELLQKTRDDLLKIRNLGKISLTEIEAKLAEWKLSLRERERKERSSD